MNSRSFFQAEQEKGFFGRESKTAEPFFSPSTIQPKLKIGAPNDKYEQEADSMADQVVQRLAQGQSVAPTIGNKTSESSGTTLQRHTTSTAIAPLNVGNLQRHTEAEQEVEEPLQRKPIFDSPHIGEEQVQRKCAACEAEEGIQPKRVIGSLQHPTIQRSGGGSLQASDNFSSRLQTSKGGGSAMSSSTRSSMEGVMGADFSGVRVHTGSEAASLSNDIGAQAFTHGSDVYFNEGKYDPGSSSGQHLLAHELTHTVQQGAAGPSAIQRHPVTSTPVDRKNRSEIFGVPPAGPPTGMTLQQFNSYTERQADWFTESTLTAADRRALWSLVRRISGNSQILSGVGDILVRNLTLLNTHQWSTLEFYCKGADSGGHTVRITPSGTLAHRIAIGSTLSVIEAVVPGEVLEIVMTQAELEFIQANNLATKWFMYWTFFHPHIQNADETQMVIDLLNGSNIWPFISLRGKVRSLHRFPVSTLNKLVANYSTGNPSPHKPFYLILFTSTDYNGAFLESISLFKNLIESPTKFVLMLEGQSSLGAITTKLPSLASTYGVPDSGGIKRISQAMIAGHGGNRSIELAGTGTPTVSDGAVHYPSAAGSLDLDDNRANTEALMNTLLDNLDPTTARVVFAGCLVGSRSVPLNDSTGTPMTQSGMASHLSNPANENMADFTRRLASSRGIANNQIQGARASVALGAASSLTNPAGNMAIQYSFDPNAFADANTYAATGREPEGVLRAAVEIAATDRVVAANQLRARSTYVISAGEWYDECSRAFAALAIKGVAVGNSIDITRLNKLAHLVDPYFLSGWAMRSVEDFVNMANVHNALAEEAYNKVLGITEMGTPPTSDLDMQRGRFIFEQGWSLLKNARIASMINYLNTYPTLTPSELRKNLATAKLATIAPLIFPVGPAVTPGLARLALAWIEKDSTNVSLRAFLNNQVDDSGATPVLKSAIKSQLSNPADERRILYILGRLTGGRLADQANADAYPNGSGPAMNDVRVKPKPYLATVIAPAHVLNVREQPSMSGRPFHWLKRGDTVNVMGFTHNWAAVDINGRLGFAHKNYLSTPP